MQFGCCWPQFQADKSQVGKQHQQSNRSHEKLRLGPTNIMRNALDSGLGNSSMKIVYCCSVHDSIINQHTIWILYRPLGIRILLSMGNLAICKIEANYSIKDLISIFSSSLLIQHIILKILLVYGYLGDGVLDGMGLCILSWLYLIIQ